MTLKQFFLVSIFGLIGVYPAYSQIIPDSTTNTSVINNCANSCNITGGELAGKNLFHSFSDFNLPIGTSVHFVDPGVTNIFSRVTGGNTSHIFGTLGVSGDANLFLLNPNGIIFGEGGTLDLNGSFVATSADEIQFGDRSFAAIPDPQVDLTLLTVDPNALFFQQMGQNGAIELNNTSFNLNQQETITLIGKQTISSIPGVSLIDSDIVIPRGNINLGAIEGNGKINLESNLQLKFPEDVARSNINLSEGSQLDVSGIGAGNISFQGQDISLTGNSQILANTLGNIDGGSINIAADNITLTENSDIASSNFGTESGADINLTAKESISLIGSDFDAIPRLLNIASASDSSINFSSTSIVTDILSQGSSGDIKLQSKNLNLSNGAWILANITGGGFEGNIDIDVSENINLDNAGLFSGVITGSTGKSSTLNINAKNLHITNGGIVSSSTIGVGDSGDIKLNVANSIRLDRSLPNRTVPTIISTTTVVGEGSGGNITVNTNKLILQDGAEISSGSGGFSVETGFIPIGGEGGNITINANDSIQIEGISPDNFFPSGIINRTLSNSPAGNIEISTGRLTLENEGIVSASSIGTGAGGNLTIQAAESIHLKGTSFQDLENLFVNGLNGQVEFQNITGGLLTNTQTGEAGNTFISTPNLTLERGALISTSTFGDAHGGSIDILTDNIDISSALISSSSTSNGDSGNIKINTQELTARGSGLITTSSLGLGNGGNLEVNATDAINLFDSADTVIAPSGFSTTSRGLSYPGNLAITTKNLTIGGGAKIDASGGRVVEPIQTEDLSLLISLEELDFNAPREILIDAESIDISGKSSNGFFFSGISSTTSSPFPASNININTSDLSISDQGEIDVNSLGEGNAGNLNITADYINLKNRAIFNANTLSGRGGNINLEVAEILSLNTGSTIKTDALGMGNGGNIDLNTTFAIASENSIISAQSVSGQGGNIDIRVKDLFITPDSLITASATTDLGIDGTVEIHTFNITNRDGLVKLPETTVKEDDSIVSVCGGQNDRQGKFSYTGKGGLPNNPLTEYSFGDRNLLADFDLDSESKLDQDWETKEFRLISPKKIVEAANWKVNIQGQVELVAKTNSNFQRNIFANFDCPFVN